MSEQGAYCHGTGSARVAYQVSSVVAWTAGIFSVVVCVFLVLSYLRLATQDPLLDPGLKGYQEQIVKDIGNQELRNNYQALDLVTRRAFFTSVYRLRTGGWLLLAGVVVFLVALKTAAELGRRLPAPATCAGGTDPAVAGGQARVAVACGSVVLVGLLVALVVMRGDRLSGGLVVVGGDDEPVPEQHVIDTSSGWPCFRGPNGIGVAVSTNAPVAWDGTTGENILWKTKLPKPGFNSPVVWGGRVFLSGADGTAREVYCFDAADGKLVWQQAVGNVPGAPRKLPDVDAEVGFAAATMATDGYRVFAIFGTGDVVCFDLGGKRLWTRNLGVSDAPYGYSSSLMVYETVLIIQYDGARTGRALGLDTRTGKTVWDKCRVVEPSWSTPIVVRVNNRMQAIMNAKPDVIGHDALTGELLWRVTCMKGEVAPSPAYAAGMVFSGVEVAGMSGIRLGETPEAVWSLKGDMPDISSPVAKGRHVFFANSAGGVFCVAIETGNVVWTHEFDSGFHASPIVAGDRLYIMDTEGVMHILRAGGTYELIGTCPLGEGATSTAAFVDGRIYLRSPQYVYCIGKKE